MQPSTSTILFKDILNCLKGFGVDPHILAAQNWEFGSPGACNNPRDKEVVIPRLVTLITTCARSIFRPCHFYFIIDYIPGLAASEEEKFLTFPLQ